MKTSELLYKLQKADRALRFKLNDGQILNGDLHITEIKNVQVESTDCGGYNHTYNETIIQLWQNERSGKTAIWNTAKVLEIVDVVERKMSLNGDTELLIEFGNSSYRTSVHGVKWIENEDEVTIELLPTYTQCKPASLVGASACC